jgi:hypothetical protein
MTSLTHVLVITTIKTVISTGSHRQRQQKPPRPLGPIPINTDHTAELHLYLLCPHHSSHLKLRPVPRHQHLCLLLSAAAQQHLQ